MQSEVQMDHELQVFAFEGDRRPGINIRTKALTRKVEESSRRAVKVSLKTAKSKNKPNIVVLWNAATTRHGPVNEWTILISQYAQQDGIRTRRNKQILVHVYYVALLNSSFVPLFVRT
jgi:hypothetical protein